MSILGTKNHTIHAFFFEAQSSPNLGLYVGNFEELRRTIATTWDKIPHDVAVKQNQVLVTQKEDNKVLATFTFMELTDQKIPDHF